MTKNSFLKLKYFSIKFFLMYLLTVLTLKYPGNNKCLLCIYNLKMPQSYIDIKPFSKFLKGVQVLVNITRQYSDTTFEEDKLTA